jgi:hypothetical protein
VAVTLGFDSRPEKTFYFLYSLQVSSEAHPAPYPMDTEGYFPGGKAMGDEVVNQTTDLRLLQMLRIR